jgi:uncharacterized protein YjbJ (UPF0337 family)
MPISRASETVCIRASTGTPVAQHNTEQEDENMSNSETGPKAAVSGAVEDVKGKAKEVAGTVMNDEEKKKEGRAQQEKASAQRDVAHHEAAAETARAEAEAREAEQRSHQ